MLRCASAFSVPVEAHFSTQPFTLRQRRLTFRSTPAARSTLPASRLQSDSNISAQPVRLRAPARVRLFVALHGTFTARRPLLSPMPELPACFRISAPLWDFSIPRDHSAQPDSRHRSLPLRVARSSFAPRGARNNFLFTMRLGSSFRIRYFPPGSLSFEPLGTILIMLLGVSYVNRKTDRLRLFEQKLFNVE
jgi:hypothetical protein